jgi:hypothetical protein
MLDKRLVHMASLNAVLWGILSPILLFTVQLGVHKRTVVDPLALTLLTVSSLSWIGTTIWIVVARRAVPRVCDSVVGNP